MNEWQPIETAPEDQSVLIYIPNAEHYGEGVYRALRKETVKKGVFIWMTTGLRHGSDLLRRDYQPTHWMPLPDPPVSEDSKR